MALVLSQLLVFWPHSVWTKSLMCKDAINKDSTFQSIFKRLNTTKKIEDFKFPVSHLDDMSSCPDVNLSTVPSVRTPNRPASSAWMTCLSVWTLHCIEKLLFQLASVRTSQQPVRTPISDRSALDSFKV
jgi:hypothetical protein